MTGDTSPNGYTPNGQFARGNPGGPGNPHAGQVAKLRAVMLEAVTPNDMRAVVRKLVEMATAGDLKAVELLFSRTLGKADSGPLVALQVNQHASEPGDAPGRAASIVERIRAARDARSEPLPRDEPADRREELQKRIDAMRV